MIQLTCRQCGKRYCVPAAHAGKRVRCKPCGTVNEVPASKSETIGSGDSLAALNKLLVALSEDEKKAPTLELDE